MAPKTVHSSKICECYCDHDLAMERNKEVTRGCGGYYLRDHGSPVAFG